MNELRSVILLTLILAGGLTLFSSYWTFALATIAPEPEQQTTTFSTFSTTLSTIMTSTVSRFNSTETLTFTNVTTEHSYTGTVTTGVTSLFVLTATTSATLTTTQTSTSTTTSLGLPGPVCPVAVAVAGTALEPYANLLRSFRNDHILKTSTGWAFMSVFNAWYYSWAPSVARVVARNEAFAEVLRVGLLPLFGILYASYYSYFAAAWLNPEAGAMIAGAAAASLIGLVYVAPVAYAFVRVLRLRKRLLALGRLNAMPSALSVCGSVLLIEAAYVLSSFALMGLATASLTLSTLTLGSIVGVRAITAIQPSTIFPMPILKLNRLKQ